MVFAPGLLFTFSLDWCLVVCWWCFGLVLGLVWVWHLCCVTHLPCFAFDLVICVSRYLLIVLLIVVGLLCLYCYLLALVCIVFGCLVVGFKAVI